MWPQTLLYFNAMKTCGGGKAYLHALSTSALDGDQRSASRPGRFNTGKDHRYPLARRWIGPRFGQEAVAKIKNSLPLPGIEQRSSTSQPSHYNEISKHESKKGECIITKMDLNLFTKSVKCKAFLLISEKSWTNLFPLWKNRNWKSNFVCVMPLDGTSTEKPLEI
jgi:hypothetical protein